MGVYEWVLMGVTCAVVIAAFFTVFAFEKRKSKKLKEAMPQYILCTKLKPAAMIILMVLAAILLVGGLVTVICGSLLIEPIPHGPYAGIMATIAFGGLFCLYAALWMGCNANYATADGIWVRRVFFKTKFYSYQEVESILDNTYSLQGGYAIFKKGRKMICFVRKSERNAKELIEVIKERSPHLGMLKENELFRM